MTGLQAIEPDNISMKGCGGLPRLRLLDSDTDTNQFATIDCYRGRCVVSTLLWENSRTQNAAN